MRYVFLILIGLIAGCAGRKQHETESNSLQLILKSIEKSEGVKSWKEIDTLSFYKKSILYLKDSAIESSSFQYQEFIFTPRLQATLVWMDDTNKKVVYNGSNTFVYQNNELVGQSEGMNSAVASAFYVISKPFNLTVDKHLFKKPELEIIDGDTLNAVKVDYLAVDESADTWWYYFTNDYSFWGSKVFHSPTYALIENVQKDTSTGFTFPSYRKSYRIDSINRKEYLRAEFWYSEYLVR